MSTTPARRRGAPAAAVATLPTPAGNPMLDVLAEGGREQFALCMEASRALSRGIEEQRSIGLRTGREAATRHQAAARRVREAAGTGELMALPWTLWQDELAAAARYWQEVAAAALETQTRLLGCACGHALDSETTLHSAAALEALEAIPGVRTLLDSSAAVARHALPR